MSFDADTYLKSISSLPDREVYCAETALAFSARMQKLASLERYKHHLQKLSEDVAERYQELLEAGATDNVETQLAALKHTLSDKHDYKREDGGDTSNNIQSADLARTIDRGQGGSIALTILYLHAARAQGWAFEALNMAGYFLGRLEKDGARVIFDPSAQCQMMQAHDLRRIVKEQLGPQGELSAEYQVPLTNREILIRLQNVVKHRQIEAEDDKGALQSVEMMRLVDPDEIRLMFEAGIFYARTQQPQEAIEVLESFIEKTPDARDKAEAWALLNEIKANSQ